MFQDFYDDIKLTGDGLYQVNPSRIFDRNKEIVRIFEGIKRNNFGGQLPQSFLELLLPDGRPPKKPRKNPTKDHNKGAGQAGGGGGGRVSVGRTQKAKSDPWSAPASVTNLFRT